MIALRRAAQVLPAVFTLLVVTSATAQSIPCGEPYTVRRGDTLQRIAERAYGPEASFRDLIEDNLQFFIGGDPSRIAIGQTLSIPCLSPEVDEIAAETAGRDQEPSSRPNSVRPILLPLVQYDGTDAAGRVAALAEEAGIAAASETRSPVAPAELVAVLSSTQLPMVADALPRPGCEAADLDSSTLALCSRLTWSAPVAEYVLSTFTLSEAGPVTRYEGLRGQRLCLPSPMPVYLLASRGVTPPETDIQRPEDVAACFTALRAGAVDAVIAPAVLADEAMATLGPGAGIMEQFALSQLVTLHSAALTENAAAREALGRLDEAIQADRQAGAARLGRVPE